MVLNGWDKVEVHDYYSEDRQMLFVDIAWRSNDKRIKPHMVAWNQQTTQLMVQQLNHQDQITWRVEGPSRCVGFRDETGKRNPCPEEMIIPMGRTQCGPCAATDYSDACAKCTGVECFATPDKLQKCREKDYAVYIVLIGTHLKVGVSTLGRVRTRWIEQGADYGAILEIVKGGDKARLVENGFGKNEEITKTIRTSRKITSLQHVLNTEEAESMIRDITGKLVDSLELDKINVEPLGGYYGIEALNNPLQDLTKRKQINGMQIRGDIIGVKGPILLIGISESVFAIDMKKLRGYNIIDDPEVSITAQAGLEEFF